jgi:hypothetical protein
VEAEKSHRICIAKNAESIMSPITSEIENSSSKFT